MRNLKTLAIMCREEGCTQVEEVNMRRFTELQAVLQYMDTYRCKRHRGTEEDLHELEAGGFQ